MLMPMPAVLVSCMRSIERIRPVQDGTELFTPNGSRVVLGHRRGLPVGTGAGKPAAPRPAHGVVTSSSPIMPRSACSRM